MTDETQVLIWQADVTHPQLSADAKEALRDVVDPELGLNIIELGLIRDVSINDEGAHVNMILTTPFCPYAPALLEMTKDKVSEVLSIEATIEMGMDPWDFSFMEEGTGADWGLF